MPSISACPLCDDVTETVVPRHTSTSPPLSRRHTDVPDPAVTDDPASKRPLAKTTRPDEPALTGIATGRTPLLKAATVEGCDGASSSGCSLTIKRLPAASHVLPTGVTRSSTTRVTGGAFWYLLTRTRRIS